MPTNKKEGMLFTTLMCFLMVFGMSTYNLLLENFHCTPYQKVCFLDLSLLLF